MTCLYKLNLVWHNFLSNSHTFNIYLVNKYLLLNVSFSCSICRKKQNDHFIVPVSKFTLLQVIFTLYFWHQLEFLAHLSTKCSMWAFVIVWCPASVVRPSVCLVLYLHVTWCSVLILYLHNFLLSRIGKRFDKRRRIIGKWHVTFLFGLTFLCYPLSAPLLYGKNTL